MRRFVGRCSALVLLAVPGLRRRKRFPEAKYGKGELKYVNGIPVLTVEGTPEEIGKQFGELALKPAKKPLIGRVDSYMKQIGWEKQFPTMVKFSGLVFAIVPEGQPDGDDDRGQGGGRRSELLDGTQRDPRPRQARRLLDARRRAGPQLDRRRRSSAASSTGRRSRSCRSTRWSIVFRAEGQARFAAVTFPVILGVLSGMNDAGLWLRSTRSPRARTSRRRQNLDGYADAVPLPQDPGGMHDGGRSGEDAQGTARTTWFCLTVCDPKGGCVFEVTPEERGPPQRRRTTSAAAPTTSGRTS